MKTRASGLVEVIALVAVLGMGAMWVKSQFFHGDTKRAEQSTDATAEVKATQAALDAANRQKSAEVAASAAIIGQAAANIQDNKDAEFIRREVPVILAKSEAPDPAELLKAAERRELVLKGELAAINRAYGQAFEHAQKLADENARLTGERDAAIAAREAIDRKLSEVAAARRAKEQQMLVLVGIAALFAALWLWAKLTHFSPWQQAKAVADIRAKTYADPVEAIDVAASPLQQAVTRLTVKLRNLFQ
jgi:hypothetical protein